MERQRPAGRPEQEQGWPAPLLLQRRLQERYVGSCACRSSNFHRGALRVSNSPVRIGEVVEHVVASVPDSVHRLTTAVADGLPVVIADPVRLEQVVGNLVDNARKYSPVGSEIEIGAARTERGVEVWVADQGRGIESEFLPHLFEPFTQAELGDTRRDHGVGLGLSICRGLVEAMGGVIDVSSSIGQGSRFTVVLPRIVPNPALPADNPTAVAL